VHDEHPVGHETISSSIDYRSTGMVLSDGRETSISYDANSVSGEAGGTLRPLRAMLEPGEPRNWERCSNRKPKSTSGELQQVTLPSGQVVEYEHDALQRRVAGEIAQELRYDEFGQVSFDSNPGFQPFGYAGGLYDPDTGLVRFGARDYDPHIGRWTAPDPIGFNGGRTNLWVYAGNSPATLVDITGHFEVGVGIEVRFDAILPTSGGFLGSGGIDLQFTTNAGIDVYLVEPVKQAGLSVGPTCQISAAYGSGGSAWPGYFDAIGGSAGLGAASVFWSPSRPVDGSGWVGVSGGVGASPFLGGVSYTRTNYSQGALHSAAYQMSRIESGVKRWFAP
jgi:RHS repeat-associated protein